MNPNRAPDLGDDQVGDGAQAHPATERRAVDAGDDRHGTGVDRLEHVGHGHRVLLVAFGVERHRRAHPGDVRAGAERRPVAGQHDRPELRRAVAGEEGERRPELGDEGRVEGVVDLGPAERDARDGVARACAFETQRLTHGAIVAGGLRSGPAGYAAPMLLAIDHLVIAVDDPDDAAAQVETRLGLAPGGGGRHDALGTFNRLVWLGDTYLELIGVFDRALAASSWIGRPTLRALDAGGGLATWAIATDAIDDEGAGLRARGSGIAEPIGGERHGPDGAVVRWRLAAPPHLEPRDRRSSSSTIPRAAEWTPPTGPPARSDRLAWIARFGSSTAISSTVRRAGPSARAARSGGVHSAAPGIVLDEEWRSRRLELRRRGESPADDRAIGPAPFAGDRFGDVRAPGLEAGDVIVDRVGRDGPRREPAAGVERAQRRRADPRGRGEVPVEHTDQLEIGVAEPDEPIERPERLVPAATPGRQPEPLLEDWWRHRPDRRRR